DPRLAGPANRIEHARLLPHLYCGGTPSPTIPCAAEVCMARTHFTAAALAALAACTASADDLRDAIDRAARAAEPRVIEWRRDIHAHPELGNREVRTAALVAKQLRKLGLRVRTGVAHTGVVAVLRGAAERPVVAL